jgi:hypothetical protein
MTTVQETIPSALRDDVDAALAWFAAREGVTFEEREGPIHDSPVRTP